MAGHVASLIYLSLMTELFSDTHRIEFRATREAGQARLQAFKPRMGGYYAQNRNADLDPGERTNVSALSPWIRHRLILEEDVARAALDRFAFSTAEKFHQEICWRTYFKGWLEHRPGVWTAYQDALSVQLDRLEANSGLRSAYEAAVSGNAGIEGFDDWATELVETGYLHNHARMWFASIWIFTLKLPWELGADFFLQNLMDGDPASNTLSWRWVGGLHTRGKTYLARRANIEKYTDGRFSPDGLSATADPLDGYENPPVEKLNLPKGSVSGRVGLLVTEEDLHITSLGSFADKISAISGCVFPADRSPNGAGKLARDFAESALEDALRRGMERFEVQTRTLKSASFESGLVAWARDAKLSAVMTGYAPCGWVRPRLDAARAALAEHDIDLVEKVRDWDRAFWPYATKGFFGLKKQIKDVYAELGLPV